MKLRKTYLSTLLVILTAGGFLLPIALYAQDNSSFTLSKEAQSNDKELSLLRLERSIHSLTKELAEKQVEFVAPRSEGMKEDINNSIKDLAGRLENLQRNFREIASGIDLEAIYKPRLSQNLDLSAEAKDLLSPLLNEVKRVTSRPREIDRLRNEIALQQENLGLIQQARNNVERLKKDIKDQNLINHIQELSDEWESKKQNTLTIISTTSQRLEQKESERVSIAESLSQVLQIFFRSRGRNLAFAFGAAFLFWFIFRWFCGAIFSRFNSKKGKTFSARLLNILYHITVSFGTVTVFLVVLYFFGDWVLLILGLLIALGVLWASKQAIPRFGSQVTIMLNMGAVREDERVIYNGIPWLVKSINFYSEFYNPELKGGVLRIPINDLIGLRSRKFESNEPWFPTHEEEWILLSDGVVGKIVLQSDEAVKIISLGGLTKTYKTSDFLGMSPTVLSRGFRITVSFGLDYVHQDIILTEIPEKLATFLNAEMINYGYEEVLKSLKIEFEEAKPSSLNFAVLADFDGDAAKDYERLKRLINRLCVDASNKYNWIIPFNKLTIEIADKDEKLIDGIRK